SIKTTVKSAGKQLKKTKETDRNIKKCYIILDIRHLPFSEIIPYRVLASYVRNNPFVDGAFLLRWNVETGIYGVKELKQVNPNEYLVTDIYDRRSWVLGTQIAMKAGWQDWFALRQNYQLQLNGKNYNSIFEFGKGDPIYFKDMPKV
ncbi:MAG: hypothetical protein ACFFD4_26870, partial [Candidatus Odinarchaeota archaeon]